MNTVAVGTTTKQANVSTVSASNSNSMHFILWFMGSKQDPNGTISIEGINAKKTNNHIRSCSKQVANQGFLGNSGKFRKQDCLSIMRF
ncbi:hypothetical protein [Flavobacterium sp. RSP49]|uniref:hypothetical protein n=1 Tax=Flavobacterium sp. RSP49 TaxID=2497487 RepID=UPI001F24438E|nr:hypothetical protein [Flavobacterium sp. RSP49]